MSRSWQTTIGLGSLVALFGCGAGSGYDTGYDEYAEEELGSVQQALSGSAKITRYWDGCKAHCAWSGNTGSPCVSCSKSDQVLSGFGDGSACDGGSAYQCHGFAPFQVSSTLSYGFGATHGIGSCGTCLELTFTGRSDWSAANDYGSDNLKSAGKKMIIKVQNTGYDVVSTQIDLGIPGGGLGLFNAYSGQLGVSESALGARYGGFLRACQDTLGTGASHAQVKSCVSSYCTNVFGTKWPTHKAACDWFVNWYEVADNPQTTYRDVACPTALNDRWAGNFGGGGGTSCTAKTCSQLGATCGSVSDGCTSTLNCGSCSSGYTCTNNTCVSSGTTYTGSGSVSWDRWNNQSGNSIISSLLSTAPSTSGTFTTFEAPSNNGDSYQLRIRGYLTAPSTGSYTFWIAGDDNVDLYISTSDNPANKTRIAYHTGYTGSREWNKFSTQKSSARSLTAGVKYYIEAIVKEGNGGDNLAVGWAKPGQSTTAPSEVIPGTQLSPFSGGTSCSLPTCSSGQCGTLTNSCGSTSCGSCQSGYTCNSSNQCVQSSCTLPTCGSGQCGTLTNSCGSTNCGSCQTGYTCSSNQCVSSGGGGGGSCTLATAVLKTGGNTGNFGTTGPYCFKVSETIQNGTGWGCSNMDGRTIKVNGVVKTCSSSISKVDGYYLFDVSAGTFAWAAINWWQ